LNAKVKAKRVEQPHIRSVAVIGSGVMGAGIAAHMANAGFQVWLLDIVPHWLTNEELEKGLTLESNVVRNRLAVEALKKMKKSKPSPLYDSSFIERIKPGNLSDHVAQLSFVDWIIEAVTERLDIKKQVFTSLEKIWHSGILVSTNTSGLSAGAMVEHCHKDFREHFAVTHFFNPPRYMELVEIVPTEETLPEVTEKLVAICEQKLGKGVVIAKDTPNFIANRIGTYGMLITLEATIQYGLTIDEADALTGVAMGRPKTATYRMLDLVGLDTLLHVVDNVRNRSMNETERKQFARPPILESLVQRGALGQKSGAGFYRKIKSPAGNTNIESIQLDTLEYEVAEPVNSPVVEAAKKSKGAANKVRALLDVFPQHAHAQFVWTTLKGTLLYAARLVGEIADEITDIDKAMQLGFNWELGPFQLWDAIGLENSVARMKAEGEDVPAWVEQWIEQGNTSFYSRQDRQLFYVSNGQYRKLEHAPDDLSIAELKEQGAVIWSNTGASLVDLGDEVLALEFHSKSNAIGSEILSAIRYASNEVSRNWRGLVLANEGKNFCVGANLMLLLMEAQSEEWEEVEDIIRFFQQSMLQLKRLDRPVVAAPHRMTLGGGVEACLPADTIIASPETYYGLVETGVGLIPAGGGCKEAAILAMQRAATGAGPNGRLERPLQAGDLQPHLNHLFETIAMAKASTSGFEIARLGFARPQDRVIMRQQSRIAEAKREVLRLDRSNYEPSADSLVTVAGREGQAVLKLAIQSMKLGRYISDHDEKIANKLAYVLCGGDVPSGTAVSEQYLLDLECEAFLSLCGEAKTQARMSHMLSTGKPLRN